MTITVTAAIIGILLIVAVAELLTEHGNTGRDIDDERGE